MKNFRTKILMASIMFSLLFSCTEDLELDRQYGVKNNVTYYETLTGLTWYLNTAYGAYMEYVGMHMPHKFMVLGSYRSDNTSWGNENRTQTLHMVKIREFTFFTDNKNILEYWKTLYVAVRYTNIVINNAYHAIEAGEDERKVNDLKAQAHTLRAFTYLLLARTYGDVPLYSEEFTPTPRSSQAEVYKDIINDLKTAKEMQSLYSYNDPDHQKGRLRKGTPDAILAKVYMYLAAEEPSKASEHYTNAYEAAKAAINSGEFELLPTYDQIWKWDNKFTKESIFEIGYASDPSETDHHQWWGARSTPRYVYERGTNVEKTLSDNRGHGYNCPTQDFVNSFEEGDPRLNWSVWMQGDSTNQLIDDLKYYEISFAHSSTGYYFRKVDHVWVPTINAIQNFKYYRFSDLLLIGAEAANEIGETADALTWLNRVRERARNTPAAPGYESAKIDGVPAVVTTTDKNELRTIIQHERRVELGLEGERFYDMVRWYKSHGFDIKGTVESAMKVQGPDYQLTYTNDGLLYRTEGQERETYDINMELPKHLYLPIPQSEINSNEALEQKYGY